MKLELGARFPGWTNNSGLPVSQAAITAAFAHADLQRQAEHLARRTHLAHLTETCEVEIGECRLDSDADIALDEAYATLSETERGRASRFMFAVDRHRFVRSRGYLRHRLGARLTVAPVDIAIVGDDGEKPYLEETELRFSLSHSVDHAVVAITHGVDVGVDLELLDRSDAFAEQLDDLSRFCMLDEELSALQALSPEQRLSRFLSFWTAKEARMKLTGEGMSLEPKAIALHLRAGEAVGYRRPYAPRATLQFTPLSRPDAICCVAVAEPTMSWAR